MSDQDLACECLHDIKYQLRTYSLVTQIFSDILSVSLRYGVIFLMEIMFNDIVKRKIKKGKAGTFSM